MIGLLGKLVALPVYGPVRGTMWIAERVTDVAEQELYDEGQIIAELGELSDRLDAGELTEDEHAQMEDALLERLAEARRRST